MSLVVTAVLGGTLAAIATKVALDARARQQHAPAQSLRERQHVRIADARDGERVRVVGRVVSRGELLRAPISGRECVLWEITIDVTDPPLSERERKRGWTQRARDSGAVAFDVEDESGRASVDVRGIAGWARRDSERTEGARPPADPDAIERIVLRYDSASAPLRREGASLRVREGIFEIDEEIAVVGRARWVDTDALVAAPYRESARARRLVISPDPDDPVCASDDPEGPY